MTSLIPRQLTDLSIHSAQMSMIARVACNTEQVLQNGHAFPNQVHRPSTANVYLLPLALAHQRLLNAS